jgi:hypothetical protein
MKRLHVDVAVDDLKANIRFYSIVFGTSPTAALDQQNAACCYARSNKYWTTDPQGIAWETFRTLDSVPFFGDDSRTAEPAVEKTACCAPSATIKIRLAS